MSAQLAVNLSKSSSVKNGVFPEIKRLRRVQSRARKSGERESTSTGFNGGANDMSGGHTITDSACCRRLMDEGDDAESCDR